MTLPINMINGACFDITKIIFQCIVIFLQSVLDTNIDKWSSSVEMHLIRIRKHLHITTYPRRTVSLPEMLRLSEHNGWGSPIWLPKGKKDAELKQRNGSGSPIWRPKHKKDAELKHREN